MSVAAKQVLTRQGVVIAVDPHKASWTAVVVTADLAAADSIRVEVNRAGYRQLRRFAAALARCPVGDRGRSRLRSTADRAAARRADRGYRRSREAGTPGPAALDRSRPQERQG